MQIENKGLEYEVYLKRKGKILNIPPPKLLIL
jgi:hypothetical protein